jgi:hypothetical protein
MAPKRPTADSLTPDEMAIMVVAICLDSALRHMDELKGKVDVPLYTKHIDEELVCHEPVSDFRNSNQVITE